MNDNCEVVQHAVVGPEQGEWLSLLRAYLVWTALTHLLWEVAQLPLYTIWMDETLAYKAFAVVHCTGGDIIIAGASVMISLVLAGNADWPTKGFWRVTLLASTIGVGYTMYSEWLNTGVRAAWTYADAMPVLPWLGTGLSPLAQWLVLPPLGLWLCRRRVLRKRAILDADSLADSR